MFPGVAFILRSKTILALWLPRCNGTGGGSVTRPDRTRDSHTSSGARHGGQARDPEKLPTGSGQVEAGGDSYSLWIAG